MSSGPPFSVIDTYDLVMVDSIGENPLSEHPEAMAGSNIKEKPDLRALRLHRELFVRIWFISKENVCENCPQPIPSVFLKCIAYYYLYAADRHRVIHNVFNYSDTVQEL